MAGQQRVKQVAQIFFILIALSLSAFTCQNGDDEKLSGPKKPRPPRPDQVATVGADVCTYCHVVATEHWMTGAHANLEAINHDTHAPLDLGLFSDGFPYYDYLSDPSCAECHDPLGDGRNLVPDLTGNLDRPVIGCESCHGGGAEHFGAGEMPYPKPAAEQCAQCHSSVFPDGHLTYHPNGDDIYEEYIQSPHAQSMNSHVFDELSGDVRARCSRCHTDEGFRKFQPLVSGRTGHDDLSDWFVGWPNLAAAETSAITCRTCHDAHTVSKHQLEAVDGETIAGVGLSPQFNTCTQCHQLAGNDGNVMSGSTDGAYHDPVANPYGSLEEVIADSHAAVPGDTRVNTVASALHLYYVNKKDPSSCAACHNPHGADLTVNREYAQSAHGDPLSDPWIHYDWKLVSRQSCQRCHTTTGAMNYLEAKQHGTAYNAAANDFSMYSAGQLQSLYCWGCHSDYKGGLRDPGAYTAEWRDMDGVTFHQFPDVSGSNVCITCHSGRESGGTIVASTSDFNNRSFYNSHYLGAAEGMFPGGGYEYTGRNYDNVGYYAHDLLGLPGLGLGSTVDAAAGSNGPCVACHMTANPQKHLFLPVEKTGDTVTAITSNLCATCHVDEYELSPDELNHEKHMLHASLDALKHFLGLRGFYYRPSHPYFFTDPVAGVGVTDWVLAAPFDNGKHNMGAAFNYNFLHHEPGAYAHNRYYTKRLIYDSIDWLDDGSLNDSVNASLTALDGVTYTWKADAMTYILSGSGGRP